MAGKRKQPLVPMKDMDEDWNQLEKIQIQAKRARQSTESNQELIVTQLVEYNEKKRQYTPVTTIKEKQFVKLKGAYTFENVYWSVWNYYADELGLEINEASHSMDILIGKFGPRAKDVAELCGKRNFLVCFEEKRSPKSVISNEQSKEPSVSEPVTPVAIAIETKLSLTKSIDISRLQLRSIQASKNMETSIKKSIVPNLKLSSSDLLALGGKLPELNYIDAKVRSLVFDYASNGFAWSEWTQVKINKGVLVGNGGFRDAFKCTIRNNSYFSDDVYIIKTFQPHAITHRVDNLAALSNDCTMIQASIELNMKAVQTLSLARILSDLFRTKIQENTGTDILLPRYVKSWLVEFADGSSGTIEEYMRGKFVKYVNNSMGQSTLNETCELTKKALAFAHFTYEYGEGSFIVTDLQGVGLTFTDPEVSTKRSFIIRGGQGEMVFGAGNLPEALANFVELHQCNEFCQMANLMPTNQFN